MGIAQFWQGLAAKISSDRLLQTPESYRSYLPNAGGFERRIQGVVLPHAEDEVIQIVNHAREHGVTLYPFSQGKNWGLGSRLPVTHDCVLVDLSQMRKILRIDHAMGFAEIEAGVSQDDLYRALRDSNAPFYLDVTGSGAHTSVLGNLLDKGIAYNTIRPETLLKLTVITGTGEKLVTGFGHQAASKVSELFPLGVGADLRGLFLQSNFGIVTSAAIALLPKPEFQCSFMINLKDTNSAGAAMEALRKLKRQGFLQCVLHMGNRRRRDIAAAPAVYNYYRRQGLPITREKAEAITNRFMKGAWSAIGTLAGPRPLVRESAKALKRAMKPYGSVLFLTRKKLDFAMSLTETLGLHSVRAFLDLASDAYGMTCGVPTSISLGSVHWPIQEQVEDPLQLDAGPAGLLFSLPIVPMTEEDIMTVVRVIDTISEKYRFKAAVTLNMLHDRALEGVINVEFPRHDRERHEAAKACVREMNVEWLKLGYCPYRLDIDSMDLVVTEESAYWRTVRDIKKVLDPQGIIAPRRYNLL